MLLVAQILFWMGVGFALVQTLMVSLTRNAGFVDGTENIPLWFFAGAIAAVLLK